MTPVGKPFGNRAIANFLGMRADGDTLYLAYENIDDDYAPAVLQLNAKGKKWVPVAAMADGAATGGFDMTDKLAIGYVDSEKVAYVVPFADGAWSSAVKVSPGPVDGLAVASDGSTTYVAYIDTTDGGKVVVKKLYEQEG